MTLFIRNCVRNIAWKNCQNDFKDILNYNFFLIVHRSNAGAVQIIRQDGFSNCYLAFSWVEKFSLIRMQRIWKTKLSMMIKHLIKICNEVQEG